MDKKSTFLDRTNLTSIERTQAGIQDMWLNLKIFWKCWFHLEFIKRKETLIILDYLKVCLIHHLLNMNLKVVTA